MKLLKKFGKAIASTAKKVGGGIKKGAAGVKETTNNVVAAVKDAYEEIKEHVEEKWDEFKEWSAELGKKVLEKLKEIGQMILDAIKNMFDFVKKLVGWLIKGGPFGSLERTHVKHLPGGEVEAEASSVAGTVACAKQPPAPLRWTLRGSGQPGFCLAQGAGHPGRSSLAPPCLQAPTLSA